MGRARENALLNRTSVRSILAAALVVAALILLAPHAAQAQAGASRSTSASSAYAGQGQSITPVSGGQLPFTGLDLAGVLGVGVVLIGAGIALRWGLRRTGRRAL